MKNNYSELNIEKNNYSESDIKIINKFLTEAIDSLYNDTKECNLKVDTYYELRDLYLPYLKKQLEKNNKWHHYMVGDYLLIKKNNTGINKSLYRIKEINNDSFTIVDTNNIIDKFKISRNFYSQIKSSVVPLIKKNEIISPQIAIKNNAYILTSSGLIPLSTYLEIQSQRYGFDSYQSLLNEGLNIEISNKDLYYKMIQIGDYVQYKDDIRKITNIDNYNEHTRHYYSDSICLDIKNWNYYDGSVNENELEQNQNEFELD